MSRRRVLLRAVLGLVLGLSWMLAAVAPAGADPQAKITSVEHSPAALIQYEADSHGQQERTTEGRTRSETIFGPDNRIRVDPAIGSIVHLESYYDSLGVIGYCSGTFVGPDLILTAAHCVYDPEGYGFPNDMAVVPGKSGESEPYGWDWAVGFAVPNGWSDSVQAGDPDPGWDYGFLRLNSRQFGSVVGWQPMVVASDASLMDPNLQPFTVGYPGDKPGDMQWATQESGLLHVDEHLVYHQMDVMPGQSGSGTFRGTDGLLFSVMSFGTPAFNAGVRIRMDVIEGASEWCREWGCDFEWYDDTGTPPPPPPPPPPSGNEAFSRTWQRTDKPVADGAVSRTWMWGPGPVVGPVNEQYAEAPGGQRQVVYYDKSRMEITNPGGDSNSIWYVTNGLLVAEMVTGQMQTGDNQFQARGPAMINVAGDFDQAGGVTYALIAAVRNQPAFPVGAPNTAVLTPTGVGSLPGLAQYGVTNAHYVPETNHTVASPFWSFMNQQGVVYQNGGFTHDQLFQNPFYATGYPIAEAYWADVKVGGVMRVVLIQCFERRCLTYTPGNPPGWDVEAGNVGQHYYAWRYGQ